MWAYIRFELKNTLGYPIAMIVGGILPLVLVLSNYHATGHAALDQATAKGVFVTLLPMVPLGLVILPFTISFARDMTSGITNRLVLFGYTLTRQLLAKFIAVLLLVLSMTTLYWVVLSQMLPLPKLSLLALGMIYLSMVCLAGGLYLLAFAIAQVFEGFNMIQGIAMMCYFGIAFTTGSMGVSQVPAGVTQLSRWIPFKIFRETLRAQWQGQQLAGFQDELLQMGVFILITFALYGLAKRYRHVKKRPV